MPNLPEIKLITGKVLEHHTAGEQTTLIQSETVVSDKYGKQILLEYTGLEIECDTGQYVTFVCVHRNRIHEYVAAVNHSTGQKFFYKEGLNIFFREPLLKVLAIPLAITTIAAIAGYYFFGIESFFVMLIGGTSIAFVTILRTDRKVDAKALNKFMEEVQLQAVEA